MQHSRPPRSHTPKTHRYSAIYTAYCVPLDAMVAIKVYERAGAATSAGKKERMAAREATMQGYLSTQW